MANTYNTNDIVISGLRHFDYSSEFALDGLCNQLNSIGHQLSAHNLRLHYHNHNCEFIRMHNGVIAYDYIIEHTNPNYVHFQLDLYWAQDAGVSVEHLMLLLGNRMKLIHINDKCYRPKKHSGSIQKFKGCELGSGVMDLERYITIAKELMVEAVILETHNDWIENDATVSMRISSEYLQSKI